MPASMRHESDNLYRIHFSGVLRQAELKDVQAVAAQEITRLGTIKLLFVLDAFEGWEQSPDWGDVTFFTMHDEDIEKIAVVGDEEWRDHALAFAGAGIRKAAVQFFPPTEIPRARAWLLQADRNA